MRRSNLVQGLINEIAPSALLPRNDEFLGILKFPNIKFLKLEFSNLEFLRKIP